MITKEKLFQSALETVRQTGALEPVDIAWAEMILNRNDGQNGFDQLRPFFAQCQDFLEKRDEIIENSKKTGRDPSFKIHLLEQDLKNGLFCVKSLYYRQKKIQISVAQRKRHPAHAIPNIGNFIASQKYRCEVNTVFGLGYAESRASLVRDALKNNCTHIFIIDDDILIPLNALDFMLSQCEPIIFGNYTKRNVTLEGVGTTVSPDPYSIFHNTIVEPKQGDFSLVPVNAAGLGFALIDLDVFRKMPEPWFEFVHEILPNGQKGKLLTGEDSRFIQKAISQLNIIPKMVPGLCAVHVDLKTGQHFGPTWLVDEQKRVIRPEFEQYYTKFVCPPSECFAPDNDTVFKNGK